MSWFFQRPIIQFECQNCHRQLSLRMDDVINGKAHVSKECPGCGNNGQNLIHCRGCHEWFPADLIPEDWDEDYCPRCAGKEVDETRFIKDHEFELPLNPDKKVMESKLRCKKCGELHRHGIHELDDDDEEEDGSADLRDSDLQEGWRPGIEEEDDD